jgi:predicted DNA-binding transcriptional regulator AlpA
MTESTPIDQDYLSPEQVARAVGLARPTIDRLLRRWRDTRGADGLRHARLSARCVRIARRDLDAYMAVRSRPSHFLASAVSGVSSNV